MQAGTGVVKEVGSTQSHDDSQIRQETVGQEQLAEPAGGGGAGECSLKADTGIGQGDGGNIAARELDEGAAKEVADAHAEGGHGQTGNILVSTKGDCQETV